MKTSLVDILRQFNIESLQKGERPLTDLEIYRLQCHSGIGETASVEKTTLLQRLQYCKKKGGKITILRGCNRVHKNTSTIK
jgi:hypothetical protein